MLPAPDGMSYAAHAVMVVGMWISNTATALIMMLIAFTVGKIGGNYKGFNPLLTAILLSVAYGSCIEMPLVVVSLPVCYFVLKYVLSTHTNEADRSVESQLNSSLKELGRWSTLRPW